tara:strand:+ start:208 stop:387 length:180 start_codon:yes stop_codon:yes gene_type:complete
VVFRVLRLLKEVIEVDMAAIHHITVVVAVVLLVLVYKELQHLKVEVEGLLKLLDMREIL